MNRALFTRNRGFARLIAAQVPSDFADWLSFVAVAGVLAFGWQAPPLAFAFLGLAMGLPYILIGPLAGVMVDRWSLSAVLIWSNLGRGLVVFSYILAADWIVLVLLVALGAGIDSFFTPAKQAALQALVMPEDRIAANSFSQAVNQTSKIAGPALGGLLLALTGPVPVFVLTAVISSLAAVMLIGQPLGPRHPTGAAKGIWAGIGTGLTLIRQSLALRAAIFLMSAGYFAIFLYDTLIAPLIADFGLGAEALGLCLAANGLGGVTGALAGAGLMRRGHPFLWVAAATALSALGIGALGLLSLTGAMPAGWLIVAVFGGAGFVGAGTIIPIRTVIQNATPPEAMGRIAALTEAATMTALLIAPLSGAALAAIGGIGLPFLCGAVLSLCIAAIAWRQGRSVA